MSVRKVVKDWIPPAIRVFRARRRSIRYRDGYRTWAEALEHSIGYDSDEVAQKVSAAAMSVRDGRKAYERDSVLFDSVQYEWILPVCACLLRIALRNRRAVRVLDFGGSLGSLYYACRSFLSPECAVAWDIVEQPKLAEIGKSEFQSSELSFFSSLQEYLETHTPEVALFSSSLQYLERPWDVMEAVCSRRIGHIVLDRTLFVDELEDRLLVQEVPSSIYACSYPVWFLSAHKLHSFFRKRSYRVVCEFEDTQCGRDFPLDALAKGIMVEDATQRRIGKNGDGEDRT